jgi:hypothetical protein
MALEVSDVEGSPSPSIEFRDLEALDVGHGGGRHSARLRIIWVRASR